MPLQPPQPSGAPPRSTPAPLRASTTAAPLTATRVADRPIAPATKRGLADVLRYETCTKVQEAALPPALGGADLVCKAKTGTGKTHTMEGALDPPDQRGIIPNSFEQARTPALRRRRSSPIYI